MKKSCCLTLVVRLALSEEKVDESVPAYFYGLDVLAVIGAA